MRMPRMTTRRLIIAVAMVGIILGIGIGTRRRFAYLNVAAREGRLEIY